MNYDELLTVVYLNFKFKSSKWTSLFMIKFKLSKLITVSQVINSFHFPNGFYYFVFSIDFINNRYYLNDVLKRRTSNNHLKHIYVVSEESANIPYQYRQPCTKQACIWKCKQRSWDSVNCCSPFCLYDRNINLITRTPSPLLILFKSKSPNDVPFTATKFLQVLFQTASGRILLKIVSCNPELLNAWWHR